VKVFFDTNVHVAEALLGKVAARMLRATEHARWRSYTSSYVLEELRRVLIDDLHFSPRLAALAQRRVISRCFLVTLRSSATVPLDPKDSPILQADLSCGADYLVTNDRHLLGLDPFQSLRIISMARFYLLLKEHGLMK
jgi:predicted nucleic acid-binding protein